MLIQIRKSQLVVILVPVDQSTVQEFRFPDQPQLRSARVDAIEVYNNLDIEKDPISGAAVITPAQMIKLFLTMFIKNADQSGMGEYINSMPFSSLHRTQTTTASPFVSDMFSFPSLLTDWSKSNVECVPGGLGNVATAAIILNVYYRIVSSSTIQKRR